MIQRDVRTILCENRKNRRKSRKKKASINTIPSWNNDIVIEIETGNASSDSGSSESDNENENANGNNGDQTEYIVQVHEFGTGACLLDLKDLSGV